MFLVLLWRFSRGSGCQPRLKLRLALAMWAGVISRAWLCRLSEMIWTQVVTINKLQQTSINYKSTPGSFTTPQFVIVSVQDLQFRAQNSPIWAPMGPGWAMLWWWRWQRSAMTLGLAQSVHGCHSWLGGYAHLIIIDTISGCINKRLSQQPLDPVTWAHPHLRQIPIAWEFLHRPHPVVRTGRSCCPPRPSPKAWAATCPMAHEKSLLV